MVDAISTEVSNMGKDIASIKTMTSVLYFIIISAVVGGGGSVSTIPFSRPLVY